MVPKAARKVKLSDLTDRDIVLAVLEHPTKLTEVERKEFDAWSLKMDSHAGYELTPRQREWVRRRFMDLDLLKTFDAESLASPSTVKGGKVDIQSAAMLDHLMGPKVLTPPPSRRHHH